jgi:hypothetical protein
VRHDIESCDQGGEDQDMTWLDGLVARASEIKIDEPIRSRDDMKWIISFSDWLVHVLHQHGRRWNGVRKAKV